MKFFYTFFIAVTIIVLFFLIPTLFRSDTSFSIPKIISSFTFDQPKVKSTKQTTFKPMIQGAQTNSIKVPILLYHYVGYVKDKNDTTRKGLSVSPEKFEEDLKFLKDNDYTFISLKDLVNAKNGKAYLPKKAVVLTFDDGYKDFYTTAFPLLKKYSAKAINFVIVSSLGLSGNLTEEEIKIMLESGLVEIGAHTISHSNLTTISLEQAKKEIEDSRSFLIRKFGFSKIQFFSYPGGYYNQEIVKLVKNAGFLGAVTVQGSGVDHTNESIYEFSRIKMGNYTNLEEILKNYD